MTQMHYDNRKADDWCAVIGGYCGYGEWEVQTRVFTVRLFDKIGKEIFLTREEAEAALKGET